METVVNWPVPATSSTIGHSSSQPVRFLPLTKIWVSWEASLPLLKLMKLNLEKSLLRRHFISYQPLLGNLDKRKFLRWKPGYISSTWKLSMALKQESHVLSLWMMCMIHPQFLLPPLFLLVRSLEFGRRKLLYHRNSISIEYLHL